MVKEEYVELLSQHPTAWKGHGLFAMKLVETFKPEVIVDLGVDYGFSTFCFAYPQIGTIYGIDWFQGDEHTGFRDTFSLVKELLKETNLLNVSLIKGDFNEVVKVWDKQIDILHIDGLHTYEAVSSDYKNWSKFCTKESIILFHDVESFPHSVGKFFSELDGFKVIKIDSAGLGIVTQSENVFQNIKKLLSEV
jgi:hypothetical protein